MTFAYRLREEAQKEYEKAIKWYLKRSLNAAEGFIDAAYIAKIALVWAEATPFFSISPRGFLSYPPWILPRNGRRHLQ